MIFSASCKNQNPETLAIQGFPVDGADCAAVGGLSALAPAPLGVMGLVCTAGYTAAPGNHPRCRTFGE